MQIRMLKNIKCVLFFLFWFFVRTYKYVFKRSPFLSAAEEHHYVVGLLNSLDVQSCEPYENWLVVVKYYPKGVVYVKMKSRGCGYIFQ